MLRPAKRQDVNLWSIFLGCSWWRHLRFLWGEIVRRFFSAFLMELVAWTLSVCLYSSADHILTADITTLFGPRGEVSRSAFGDKLITDTETTRRRPCNSSCPTSTPTLPHSFHRIEYPFPVHSHKEPTLSIAASAAAPQPMSCRYSCIRAGQLRCDC